MFLRWLLTWFSAGIYSYGDDVRSCLVFFILRVSVLLNVWVFVCLCLEDGGGWAGLLCWWSWISAYSRGRKQWKPDTWATNLKLATWGGREGKGWMHRLKNQSISWFMMRIECQQHSFHCFIIGCWCCICLVSKVHDV